MALMPLGALMAQRGRRGGTGGAITPAPIKGVIVTFRGRLKQLAKKTILLEGEDNQIITIRRNSKTKFWTGNKEVKAQDFDLESLVMVEAVEDNDLKFAAVNVRLDPDQKKRTLNSDPKQEK